MIPAAHLFSQRAGSRSRTLSRPGLPAHWLGLPLVLAGLLLPSGDGMALDSLTIQISSIENTLWSATGIELRLVLEADNRIGATVLIDELTLPAPVGAIRQVRLRCPTLELRESEYRCARTEARVGDSHLDDLPFTCVVRYRPRTESFIVSSTDVPMMGQRVAVDGQWQPSGWSAHVRANRIDARSFYGYLSGLISALPDLEGLSGSLSVDLSMSISDTGRQNGTATLDIRDLAVSNDSGTVAADSLAARITAAIEAAADSDVYEYRLAVSADHGEAYLEPVYFDLNTTPLTLESTGKLDIASRKLSVSELGYQHSDTVTARATAEVDWGAATIESATVAIDKMTFPYAYTSYIQGFLVGTPLAELETGGRLRGKFALTDNRLRTIDIRIDEFDADGRNQGLAIYQANGDIHWRGGTAEPPANSRVAWNGGFIGPIGYGASAATFVLSDADIALVETLRVPLLGGALVIDTFSASNLDSQQPAIDFDARLEPIGLRRLTAALGWPAFPGSLSGELPRLSLRDGVVTLGGRLEARVFDGTALFSSLRIEEPFSMNRRSSADIELKNLDLELMTDVLTLGRITGRLDGRIDGLRTVKNRPVAFDARFYTPPGDNSRRRISRRAIDNLSEIAGSGTALLSGGLLKFFEDFAYSSIGIRCRLQGDVCEMSGVKPAADGYYLVEGSGLPRIDVIGHSREVNWSRLTAQIEQALKSTDTPSVKPSESPQ